MLSAGYGGRGRMLQQVGRGAHSGQTWGFYHRWYFQHRGDRGDSKPVSL